MPEPSDIDTALVSKLGSDPTLLGHMPNGVYWDMAPANAPPVAPMTQFVIVSLVLPREVWKFGGVSHVESVYLVKAVAMSIIANASASAKAAAAQINVLLHGGTLAVPGYTLMSMARDPDTDPWIHRTEPDDADSTLRWYHRGGHYRVVMST